jgi:hypothetical protein
MHSAEKNARHREPFSRSSDEGDQCGVAEGGRRVGRVLGRRAGQIDEHLHGPCLAGIATQVSAELELVELVRDAGQGLEADRVPDLAHARRVPVTRDRTLDHLEDRQLLVAEALAPSGLGLVAPGRVAHVRLRPALRRRALFLRMSEARGGVLLSKPYPDPRAEGKNQTACRVRRMWFRVDC